MPGSQTTQGRSNTRTDVSARVAFRDTYRVGALSNFTFAAQWLAYTLPSTLRRHPRGCRRTAWGQCGSLLLHCNGVAPSTPCRSPGAQVMENPI